MSLEPATLVAVGTAWSAFTGMHLWGAARFAREAHRIEQEGLRLPHPPDNHSLVQHYVVATVLLSASAIEAFPSELGAPADGVGRDVNGEMSDALVRALRSSNIAAKYDALASAEGLGQPRTFMSEAMAELDALVRLRNKLVHFVPELPGSRNEHDKVEAALQTRIAPSPLLPGARLFPDGFGSYSCAKWSVTTARRVIEGFAAQVGVTPAFLEKPVHAEKMCLP